MPALLLNIHILTIALFAVRKTAEYSTVLVTLKTVSRHFRFTSTESDRDLGALRFVVFVLRRSTIVGSL